MTTGEKLIAGGLAVVAAPIVAVAGIEGGLAVLANPATASAVTIGAGEIAAGDALGAGTLAVGTAALTSRAKEIHGSLDKIAQSMRTTAVVDTAEGVRVVASSERGLASSQKAALGANEIAATGPGHAEVTAVNTATAQGLTPTAVGASREICPECQKFLDERNIRR